jgi:hypothetical protein
MPRLILIVVVAVLAACTGAAEYRAERFEDVALVYSRALEWSDFSKAHRLVTNEKTTPPLEEGGYDRIKVTTYEPGRPLPGTEPTTLKRRAKLRYIELTRMSQRSLALEEEWRFVEAEKRWYLHSGFPQFK